MKALSRTHSWTKAHQPELGRAFCVLLALGLAADLVLMLVLKVPSISSRTWAACEAHPAIIAGGVLASVGVCYLVRGDWRLVMLAGLLGGHLFIHS